mmetsp:Transcript_30013/g.41833  ORF Transcript_30013/g.41833 Transcript_30013/m.41833 type:complete len:93 (-) Transcript_30013:4-282(-)
MESFGTHRQDCDTASMDVLYNLDLQLLAIMWVESILLFIIGPRKILKLVGGQHDSLMRLEKSSCVERMHKRCTDYCAAHVLTCITLWTESVE